MPVHTDFKDISYQAVIYTPRLEFKKAIILRDILGEFSDLFDDDPEILPWGDDVPGEIPRIQLKNTNKIWLLKIALTRLDLTADSQKIDRAQFIDTSIKLIEMYKSATNAIIGRVAFVLKRFYEEEDPGKKLALHFCKEEWTNNPLNRPEDFKLHAFKRYEINEQIPEINSWIRHNVGKVQFGENGKKSGIIVEQDLNTSQEKVETSDFEMLYINNFFAVTPSQMDEILEKYYPVR